MEHNKTWDDVLKQHGVVSTDAAKTWDEVVRKHALSPGSGKPAPPPLRAWATTTSRYSESLGRAAQAQ